MKILGENAAYIFYEDRGVHVVKDKLKEPWAQNGAHMLELLLECLGEKPEEILK
jgi:hypothetical protein